MKTFKVMSPVTVISRKLTRSFDKADTVSEAELTYVMEHFRSCFEEVVPKAAEPEKGA